MKKYVFVCVLVLILIIQSMVCAQELLIHNKLEELIDLLRNNKD